VHEYSLSSQEGVALMCLAEALLRIPDTATRDALIRDKISEGDWMSHVGGGRSLFVNAATWGLVVTGKLTSTVNDRSLTAALTRLIARCRRTGDPPRRRYGDADDGRAVRHRRNNRRGAEARAPAGSKWFPLFLRHAGRGSDHGSRRQALLPRLRETRSTPSARPRTAAASMKGPASRSSCRPCTRAMSAPSRPASWASCCPR
jgi:hypothetical protein